MTKIVIYISILFLFFSNKLFNNNSTYNLNSDKQNSTIILQKKYYSPEGDFKIMFPGEPTVKKSDVPTEVGTIKMYQYMYEQTPTKIYMVAFSDYPSKYMEASKSYEMLQNAKGGFINSLKITVKEENAVKIRNHPGIMFKASDDGIYVVMRDYLVNNRLFQIGIMQQDYQISEKDIEDFIYSFELVK
ncbi:MAG: hypothetical protein JXR51_06540 [Bacteroidales bacterium]|nr:hypothetical protein [Bacteroidales bacterium]